MNLLTRLYPGDAFSVFALTVLVHIAVVALLAVGVSRTLARRNAALRHCILLSALIWILFSPLAASHVRRIGVFSIPTPTRPPGFTAPRPAVFTNSSPASHDAITDRKIDARAQPGAAQVAAAKTQNRAPVPELDSITISVSVALLVSIAGLIFQLVRLAGALGGVWRIRRASGPAPALVAVALGEVWRTLSVSKPPMVVVCDRVCGPVTIGVVRRMIVLPAGLVEEVGPGRLREILIHEAVHVCRHDYAIGIFQRLIGAVLWFHPAVLLLNRELSRAREEVCDNAVLRAGRATDYARTLLELSERMRPGRSPRVVPGLFGDSWPLRERVAGILNQRRVVMTRVSIPMRVVVCVVTVGCGIFLAGTKATTAAVAGRGDVVQDRGDAASQPSGAGPATRESFDLYQSLQRPQVISAEEEKLREEEQKHLLAVGRSDLDMEEAKITVQKEELDLKRKEALLVNHGISVGEVDEMRLIVSLAKIRLQRAQLQAAELRGSWPVVRRVQLTVYDGPRHVSETYSVRSAAPSVSQFVTNYFPEARKGNWEVSVIRKRDEGHSVIMNAFTSIGDAKFNRETVQTGDNIVLRRDIVGVYVKDRALYTTALHGEKIRLKALLEKAGVKLDPDDRTGYEVIPADYRSSQLRSPRAGGSARSGASLWTLGQLASGKAPDELLEAGDSVEIRR